MGNDNNNKKVIKNFEIKKAKFLVKKCLSKDKLYQKYLDYIICLDDYSFEQLIKGKNKINYNSDDKYQFLKLVAKFNDYSKIIYNWHKDKKRYDGITLLWENDVCIFQLYNLDEEQFHNKLKIYNLPEDFIVELKTLLDNTIEAKTPEILDYLKEKFTDYYDIISFATNEETKLIEKNKNEKYSSNLCNIINGLIYFILPALKNFMKKIEKLDPLSKSEIKEGNFLKLKKFIKLAFTQKNSNTIGHQKLIDLAKNFKCGKTLETFLGQVKDFYSLPLVSLAHLALSFLNLCNSIENFNKFQKIFKQDNKQISREYSKIFHDFEIHKKEIGILDISDLTNINLSNEKVKEIRAKILYDQQRLLDLNRRVKEAISEAKAQKIKSGISIAIDCLGIISSIIGAVLTGGLSCIIYVAGVALNTASLSINSVIVHKINIQLDFYNKMLEEGIQKEKEIEKILEEIEKKYM
jgi:hypothetical protein